MPQIGANYAMAAEDTGEPISVAQLMENIRQLHERPGYLVATLTGFDGEEIPIYSMSKPFVMPEDPFERERLWIESCDDRTYSEWLADNGRRADPPPADVETLR